MISCTVLKLLDEFNIAKYISIITKSFCSGTYAGLGEIESMTRVKEHPSYEHRHAITYLPFFSMDCGPGQSVFVTFENSTQQAHYDVMYPLGIDFNVFSCLHEKLSCQF